MAKTKYITNYPKQLKKKANELGLKISKSTYRFLDHFLMMQEDMHPSISLVPDDDDEKIIVSFTPEQGEAVQMQMGILKKDEIHFTAVVAQLTSAEAKVVGEQILRDKFIDNYLALKLSLIPCDAECFDLVMSGVLWQASSDKNIVADCDLYFWCFIEQMNLCIEALEKKQIGSLYRVRISDFDRNNRVTVARAVREITGLGLRAAHELFDEVSEAVLVCGSKNEAFQVITKLHAIGVSAELL